ncbi:MAG: iron ABC transporter permease [Candidatus Margulisbacteria bacterium]|nr:iron ABC transporter permease [Candidatus Margulisiibacteriota bacterium]
MNKNQILIILCSVLLLLAVISVFLGPVMMSPGDLMESPIFLQIRLPRVLLSVLVGVLLAISGVMLQAILRNPLADPYILGVSAGAGVGASIALGTGMTLTLFGLSSTPILAFMGALLAVFVVYNLSKVAGRTSTETLILAGVAVSSFAAAILALIIITTGKLQSIYFWLLGSLSSASWSDVITVTPYMIFGLVIAYFYSKELNALLLGEDMAQTLGVDVEKLRILIITTATLVTAAAVSVSGLVGFVGLIIPHFVRMILGANHRYLVPFPPWPAQSFWW